MVMVVKAAVKAGAVRAAEARAKEAAVMVERATVGWRWRRRQAVAKVAASEGSARAELVMAVAAKVVVGMAAAP